MIEIVHMPFERKKFDRVLESIELRRDGIRNEETWIGQAADRDGELEEHDRSDCFHVLNQDANRIVGYARLVPVGDSGNDETVSGTIAELARQSNRYPAFELQSVSFTPRDDHDDFDCEAVLRELIIETMRVANQRQCRFIYTTCDRGGTAVLRKIGLRYSTLSAPFPVHGRPMVILCIAVTNSNILALNPFRVVGGTEAASSPNLGQEVYSSTPARPSEFSRLEAIASLKDQCDDPVLPSEL